MFGLVALPLLGAIGLAMDFGQLMVARSASQMAADAAALYASGYAKELIRTSDGSDAKVTAAFAEAKTRAESMFRAQVARITLLESTVSVALTRTGQDIGATADFTLKTKATLGQLFSISTLSAQGRSAAGASLPTYTDLYMALDVSQSMGLASTDGGAKTLFKAVQVAENGGKGCVFGCHVTAPGTKTSKTYQQIAKDNSVPLRVDVLRDSVTKTINTAENDGAGASTYRIALYTMGLANGTATSPYALRELSALSGNFAALRSAATGIDLGPNNSGGTGDTYLNEPIKDLAAKIPVPGDGSSQTKAKAFAIIVTDGVRDVAGSCTYGHCIAPIDPSSCKALKDKNITVGVIYTTYLPILDDPTTSSKKLEANYSVLVEPIAADIAPKLKSCATSAKWYAEASDGPAIDIALAEMFAQTTKQATLSY